MSYSMGSLDTLGVRINESYIEALKKDVETYVNDHANTFLKSLSENQQELFMKLYDTLEAEDLEDIDCFTSNHCDNVSIFTYEENYCAIRKLDVNSGKFGDIDEVDYISLFCFGGTFNAFKPEFENKEDMYNTIKQYLYIPTTFDLDNNIVFLTGIWGG